MISESFLIEAINYYRMIEKEISILHEAVIEVMFWQSYQHHGNGD